MVERAGTANCSIIGDIRNSRIANIWLRFARWTTKPQDLLVLLKVAAHPPQRWTYAALGEALAMSASEAHASVKRAVASGLAVAPSRGEWSPVRPNLLEFVLHGVRYVWPATSGPVKRNITDGLRCRTSGQRVDGGAGRPAGMGAPDGKAKGPDAFAALPHGATGRAGRPGAAPPTGPAGRPARRACARAQPAAKLMEAELMRSDAGMADASR